MPSAGPVTAEDLTAIKDAYFDAQGLATLRLAALRASKAGEGAKWN